MSAVARRYAKALFALAKEGGTLQPAAEQLERVAAFAGDPTVAPVLRSPLLSAERRAELVAILARETGLSDLLARFVRLLGDHRRLGELRAIHDAFQHLLDAELGRVRISIRTATPLATAAQADIVATFSTLTGKQVLPQVAVEPDLLGGVVVEVEGKVYDGTVRTQLDRLAKELAGTASL